MRTTPRCHDSSEAPWPSGRERTDTAQSTNGRAIKPAPGSKQTDTTRSTSRTAIETGARPNTDRHHATNKPDGHRNRLPKNRPTLATDRPSCLPNRRTPQLLTNTASRPIPRHAARLGRDLRHGKPRHVGHLRYVGSRATWAPAGPGTPRRVGTSGMWAPARRGKPRDVGTCATWAPARRGSPAGRGKPRHVDRCAPWSPARCWQWPISDERAG